LTWLATRNAAYIRVTQAVADGHTDGQMDGRTLCDNKGLSCASRANITQEAQTTNSEVNERQQHRATVLRYVNN